MSCSKTFDNELQQGNSTNFHIQVLDLDTDEPYNLGGVNNVTYELSKRVGSTTAYLTKTLGDGVLIVTPSEGLIKISLTDAETGALPSGEAYHQCKITETSGTSAIVFSETLNILQRR